MPDVVLPRDSSKRFTEHERLDHNRRHPEIPREDSGMGTPRSGS